MAMTVRRLLLLLLPVFALLPGRADAIVGGTNAPPHTYDAVANVEIAGLFGCTGTLVAPDLVLTAGHCGSLTGATGVATPISFPPQALKVTLGTTAADGTGGEPMNVKAVTIPPKYLGTGAGFDISLLRLTAPSKQTPVRIAGQGLGALWAPGVLETIAGFGTTSSGGDAPATMQVAQVPIVTDADCAKAYPDSFEAESQLCAGYPQGGVDSCQGDSGGPLFGHDAAGALKVVGSTSYGEGCAEPGFPGVYARVADTTLREYIRTQEPTAIADAGTTAPAPAAGPGAGAPGAATPAPAGTPDAAARAQTRGEALGLAAKAQRRSRLRTRGVALRLFADRPGTALVRLKVSKALARKTGLKSRIVARRTVRVKTPGTRSLRIKLSARTTRKLRKARARGLVATATYLAKDGTRASRLALVALR